jgi:hypothetical protein
MFALLFPALVSAGGDEIPSIDAQMMPGGRG